MMKARGVARVGFVVSGALAAALLASAEPSNLAYASGSVVALAVVAGASGSRWYFTPALTTFLVLSLLLRTDAEEGPHRVLERVGDNLLGAILAVVFVGFLPSFVSRTTPTRP